jgi:hypothetical protein
MSTPTDFVYAQARIALGSGSIDLLTADVRAMLVTNQYVPAPNSDQYVSSIPSGAIIIRDIALTSLSFNVSGYFRGTVPPFNSFLSSSIVTAIVLYVLGSSDPLSPLLYYSAGGPGFPFQPQGFNYIIGYDQASGGWFQP